MKINITCGHHEQRKHLRYYNRYGWFSVHVFRKESDEHEGQAIGKATKIIPKIKYNEYSVYLSLCNSFKGGLESGTEKGKKWSMRMQKKFEDLNVK